MCKCAGELQAAHEEVHSLKAQLDAAGKRGVAQEEGLAGLQQETASLQDRLQQLAAERDGLRRAWSRDDCSV